MSGELSCDAVAAVNCSAAITDVSRILDKLSDHDVRSALFLAGDFSESDDFINSCRWYLQWSHKSSTHLRHKLLSVLVHRDVLIEILQIMRLFKLLKELGQCAHQPWNVNAIDRVRKFLYSICEEIDDIDLEKLKRFYSLDIDHVICAEELICTLIIDGKIHKDDLSELASAMKIIQRNDIADKILGFRNTQLPIVEKNIIQRPSKSGIYPTLGIRFAVIINQEEFNQGSFPLKNRIGTEVDAGKITHLLEHFAFRYEIYRNFTKAQILEKFQMTANTMPGNCSVFLAFLLSHGDKGIIYGSDCQPVQIWDLIDIMSNKCPHLKGKPKVFFVQACQGQEHPQSIDDATIVPASYSGGLETDGIRHIPPWADYYLASATVPGYVCYRDIRGGGSLFISSLVKHLQKSWQLEDIEVIMKSVRNDVSQIDVSNCYQMPMASSTLRKKLILLKN